MLEIIRGLCTYVETGDPTAQIKAIEEQCGKDQTLAVVVRLLQWLQSQFDRPLDLKVDRPLSRAIANTVSASPDLCLLLEIKDNQVRFKDSVPQEERQEIKDFARSKPLGRLMGKPYRS